MMIRMKTILKWKGFNFWGALLFIALALPLTAQLSQSVPGKAPQPLGYRYLEPEEQIEQAEYVKTMRYYFLPAPWGEYEKPKDRPTFLNDI
jgi:hypothetical protein